VAREAQRADAEPEPDVSGFAVEWMAAPGERREADTGDRHDPDRVGDAAVCHAGEIQIDVGDESDRESPRSPDPRPTPFAGGAQPKRHRGERQHRDAEVSWGLHPGSRGPSPHNNLSQPMCKDRTNATVTRTLGSHYPAPPENRRQGWPRPASKPALRTVPGRTGGGSAPGGPLS